MSPVPLAANTAPPSPEADRIVQRRRTTGLKDSAAGANDVENLRQLRNFEDFVDFGVEIQEL